MSYELKVEQREGYLAIQVTGDNRVENVIKCMEQTLDICNSNECYNVLVHECLKGPRLDALAVFNVAAEGSLKALGQLDALAYVDEKMGEMADFAETVAVNRGMPLRIFTNLQQATSWIEAQVSNPQGQRIFLGSDELPDDR